MKRKSLIITFIALTILLSGGLVLLIVLDADQEVDVTNQEVGEESQRRESELTLTFAPTDTTLIPEIEEVSEVREEFFSLSTSVDFVEKEVIGDFSISLLDGDQLEIVNDSRVRLSNKNNTLTVSWEPGGVGVVYEEAPEYKELSFLEDSIYRINHNDINFAFYTDSFSADFESDCKDYADGRLLEACATEYINLDEFSIVSLTCEISEAADFEGCDRWIEGISKIE